jgi:hypothetical protein
VTRSIVIAGGSRGRVSLSKGATISVLPIARRLAAVRSVLLSYAEGRAPDYASKENILRMRAVGTSRVRRLLQRSAYSRSYRLQMSSVAAHPVVHDPAPQDRRRDPLPGGRGSRGGLRLPHRTVNLSDNKVGAGRGKMTVEAAERVGPSGHVFSNEFDPKRLAEPLS